MSWHVVSVNTRMEIETANRINSGGFVAHCPVWVKKYGMRRRGADFFRVRDEPLFPAYIFVRPDALFRKDKFEDSKVRLHFLPNGLITEGQMDVIKSTAAELTAAQSKFDRDLPIKRGDLMQILHGAMQGDHVEVLRARKDQILVDFKRRAGWRPAWINRASLGRAV